MYNSLKNKNDAFHENENLLAMISHDLKNPVNAGIMAVKLLEDKKLSPLNSYQEEILDNIMISLKYMKNLIENILDRYKFNNEVYKINKISVDFISFVTTVINEAKYIFSEKFQSVKLIVELKNGIADIDSLEIKRVINNLIANSSKYSPEMSEIVIRIFDKKENIGFSIENQGCGVINPQAVFEKFVTYNDSSKSVATGLGLYIVKEIIKAHGGDVFMESEKDKFTRVTFTLPRK